MLETGFRVAAGQFTMEELAELLEMEAPIWVRVVAVRPAGVNEWQLRVAEATLREQPPAWEPVDWEYPEARLVADVMDGPEVATWIHTGRIAIKDLACAIVPLGNNAVADRRASQTVWAGQQPLHWPADEWRMSIQESNVAPPAGPLVSGSAAPFFGSLDIAMANLLGLTETPNWNLAGRDVVIRRQDKRGRIRYVLVDEYAGTVRVTVDGGEIQKAVVALAGDRPGETKIVDVPEEMTLLFEPDAGLPSNPWVGIAIGDELLDQKRIGPDRVHSPEPGVDYVPPPFDPDHNSPFTFEEQTEIAQTFHLLKIELRLLHAAEDPEAVARVEEKLDVLLESAKTSGRASWRDQLRGALWGLGVDRLVSEPVLATAYRLLHVGVGYMLAQHGVPQLPQF